MTDQSFLASGGFSGGANYGLQNLLGLAALALWLISSTIAAPIVIQQALETGAQVGQALFATTATAGIAGATAAVGAATTFGAAGGLGGFIAGTTAGGMAGILGAAEASATGSSYSPAGNLIGSLGAARQTRRPPRRLAGLVQRGQQDANEQGNDPDHHEQLDQRKAARATIPSAGNPGEA